MSDLFLDDITGRLSTLSALRALIPPSGLRNTSQVAGEFSRMISEDYVPFFLGSAAQYISASCRRCGRCCIDVDAIAVAPDDCRRMAKHLGISLKRFEEEYTLPHALAETGLHGTRMIARAKGEACPFYDPGIPGCRVHRVKPRVCSAAYYLTRMNLITCEEMGGLNSFPGCPADEELQSRLHAMKGNLKERPDIAEKVIAAFRSEDFEAFRILLRLKGIQIYFGKEKASSIAKKLGIRRLPMDEELQPLALLYAAMMPDLEI